MASSSRSRTLARGLGWFGIGLGLCELFATRQVARRSGLLEHKRLLRWFGAREIVSGIPLLAAANPQPWLWGRVIGDLLDGGLLAKGMSRSNPLRNRTMAATAFVAPVVALDMIIALRSKLKR